MQGNRCRDAMLDHLMLHCVVDEGYDVMLWNTVCCGASQRQPPHWPLLGCIVHATPQGACLRLFAAARTLAHLCGMNIMAQDSIIAGVRCVAGACAEVTGDDWA